MRAAEGGFASAQDADTDGEEGATYVWTPHQLRDVLEPAEPRRPPRYYGVTEAGQLRGRSDASLRPEGDPPAELGRDPAPTCSRRATLRPQPARDDKAIAAWNGLALAALAEAGWRLRPRRLPARRPSAAPSSCSARSARTATAASLQLP